jgi:hypothetical protein
MEINADLSALEKAVTESEKNVAALLARANELADQKTPLEPADPLDTRDPITTELGVLPSPAVVAPMVPKSSDKGINLATIGLALLGAVVVYKIIK